MSTLVGVILCLHGLRLISKIIRKSPTFMMWSCHARPEPQTICCLLPSAFLFNLCSQSFSSPDDYIIPERASCLGCPVDIDENSEDLRGPLLASISKYNSISKSTHLFTLHTVGHATRQVETGWYEGRENGSNVRWSELLFLSYLLSQCIPVGGRRFQVQA